MNGQMTKKNSIESSLTAGNYTVLFLKQEPHPKRKNTAMIDGKEYELVIVYDLPNAVAIKGFGDFAGKTVYYP